MSMETTYAIMYMEINLVAILLVGIVAAKTNGLSKMVAQRNFSMSIGAEIFFFLSDTIHVMAAYGFFPYTKAIVLTTKTVYFFSTTLMCYFWFVYFEYMQESPFVENRRRVWLSSFLVWVIGGMLVINLFAGFLFYVDDDGKYQRGSAFLLLYLLPYIYVFTTSARALIALIRRKGHARKRQLILLALFPLAPAGAGILQFLYPQLPLACAALSLLTLGLYLEWVDQMISVDPLTHLNNRKQMAFRYDTWITAPEKDQELYLMMIDANKFKSINDTYGHIEGDAALIRIADALRLGCREHPHKSSVSRYGGDEFVALVWVKADRQKEELQHLTGAIHAQLARLNKEADIRYELTVSIGIAKAEPGMSLKHLIENADALLYDEKRR